MLSMLKRGLGAHVCSLLLVVSAYAFTPQAGSWYNPAEPGTGLAIEVQNDVMIVGYYLFSSTGAPEWYTAAGPLVNNKWSGSLTRLRGGQCLGCNYTSPTTDSNLGTLSITFTSGVKGAVAAPNGRIFPIQRVSYGYDNSPQSLLGKWTFVFTIISDFVNSYNFTSVGTGTANGTGLVLDSARFAGAEWQVKGSYAGTVLMVDLNSTGTVVENQFVFIPVVDQVEGFWVSSTNNAYDMRGFRRSTPNGTDTSLTKLTRSPMGLAPPDYEKLKVVGPLTAEQQGAFDALADQLRTRLRADGRLR